MVNHLSTFFRFRLKILLDVDLDHLLLGDHRSYDYAVGISSVLDPEWEEGPRVLHHPKGVPQHQQDLLHI